MAIYKLEEIANVFYGKSFEQAQNEKYPVYSTGGVTATTNNPQFKQEGIIVPRVGSMNIFYSNSFHSTKNTAFSIQTKNENNWLTKYIYFVLLKNQNIIFNKKSGSAVPKMTSSDYKNFYVNMPNIITQKQIIDIIEHLEQMEMKILKITENIEKMLKKIPETKVKAKFSEYCDLLRNSKKDIFQMSAKVMNKRTSIINDIEDRNTYLTNTFFVPKGTIVINTIRTYLEKFAIVPMDLDATGTLLHIKTKTPSYFLKELLNDNFWTYCSMRSHGTKMPIIKKEDFLEYEFNLPKFEIKNVDILLSTFNEILLKIYLLKKQVLAILIK